MKSVVSGVAAAALAVLTSVALAQPAPAQTCAFTPAPTIPDGATATNAAMVAAREALQQWRTVRAAEIAACKVSVDEAQARLNALQAAHNRAVTETDAAVAQFAAENAEYSARARPRPRGR